MPCAGSSTRASSAPGGFDAHSSPSDRRLALRVTAAAQRALRSGHPWLFDQAITSQGGEGRPGDLAVIFDDRKRFLAVGLYDPTSPLRVRVLQHVDPVPIDSAWFRGRLAAAAALRASLPASGTTGYRLVYGENDGLPGLVIDRYESVLVVKLYTLAWIPRLAELLTVLEELVPAQSIVLRLTRAVAARPEFLYDLADGSVLAGAPPDGPVLFSENGLRFEADVLRGQKTGFFLDQRDNRARSGPGYRPANAQRLRLHRRVFALCRARRRAGGVERRHEQARFGRRRAQFRLEPRSAGGGRRAPQRAGGRCLRCAGRPAAAGPALRPGDRRPASLRQARRARRQARCMPTAVSPAWRSG